MVEDILWWTSDIPFFVHETFLLQANLFLICTCSEVPPEKGEELPANPCNALIVATINEANIIRYEAAIASIYEIIFHKFLSEIVSGLGRNEYFILFMDIANFRNMPNLLTEEDILLKYTPPPNALVFSIIERKYFQIVNLK
ncbi:hypothetical protein HZS_2837 [Henneguya salminicola]|nr:hypothetical protein HZS_2837 [Henneguya salminicola]